MSNFHVTQVGELWLVCVASTARVYGYFATKHDAYQFIKHVLEPIRSDFWELDITKTFNSQRLEL